jgi:small-conductance mechanosensitive channel
MFIKREVYEKLLESLNNSRQENIRLSKKLINKTLPKASEVIKSILGRTIKWVDYEDLPEQERDSYYRKAKEILENDVFKNEINRATVDIVNTIAYQCQSYEEVQQMRFTLNGIKILQERLESLAKADEEEPEEEELFDV